MVIPKYLTTVTPLSKTLALILFILLPIMGFKLGMDYNQMLIQTQTVLPALIPTPTNMIKPKVTLPVKSNLTWEECTKMPGSRVQMSYPPICVTTDGRRVVEPVQ